MIQNTTLLTHCMHKLLEVKYHSLFLAKVYFIIKWTVFIPCLGSCGPSFKEQNFLIEHNNSKTCFIFIGRLICGLQLLYVQHANAVIEQNQLQNCMT